jgi:hypothetical protein
MTNIFQQKKGKHGILLVLAAVFTLFLATVPTACYYDNEEELYGITPGNCDTVAVKFSTVIQPLLNSECTSCHSPSGSQPDIPLDTYDNVKNYVTSGTLVERTNDSNSPMPPSGLMDNCRRNKIQAWVNQGALNN